MKALTTVPGLRRWVAEQRTAGRRIGLVPTMGALHEGHLTLVDEARRRSDAVIVSVFVNPLQFGPNEDLARYPRDLERDLRLAADRGADAVFAPGEAEMYPAGDEIRVVPGTAATRWEGEVRPGHFTGVLTVVAKLFNLVQPDVAVFGQKDIQQATLIRQLVRDLDFPLEVAVAPTVREPDGLALSSRNAYLTPAGRQQAVALSRALQAARSAWSAGERSPNRIEALMRQSLAMFPGVRVDYIAVVEPVGFQSVEAALAGTIVAVAGRVGSTRLLDNVILGSPA
jgi:pantoate--beta-alanine ligase